MVKIWKLINMKEIVDRKFVVDHQDEILKLGDIIPLEVVKYISDSKIKEYFEFNRENILGFSEEYESVEEWKNSEKLVEDCYFPEDTIQLLKEWVDCYPQFKDMLNEEYFEEYIENDRVLNHSQDLNQIEKRFHDLIMQRAGIFIEKYNIEMPHITRFT